VSDEQKLHVHNSILKELQSIAEQQQTSIDTLADQFLQNQIDIFKDKQKTKTTTDAFKNSLTKSLRNVELDHPIFGGKKPKTVEAIMVTPLEGIYGK